MLEIEQYLQAGDIELRVEDIKILLEEHNNMKQDIKRLKEEYVMLQNASDEVEEEKDKEIERLNNIINEAIEYIEENKRTYENDEYCFDDMIDEVTPLLNILKGSDKE